MLTASRLASTSRLVLGQAPSTSRAISTSRSAYAARKSQPSKEDRQDVLAEDKPKRKATAKKAAPKKATIARSTPAKPVAPAPEAKPAEPAQPVFAAAEAVPDAKRAEPVAPIFPADPVAEATKPAESPQSGIDDYMGTSEGGKGSAPTSMWTAPQSLLNPSVPARRKPFDEKRADVYFRRVAQPEKFTGPPPAMWQRYATIGAGFLSAGITVYFLYFAEFGEREHVFSGIRRALRDDAVNPFGVSAEERQWVEIKKAEKADSAAARVV